jgi:hypothetical protein
MLTFLPNFSDFLCSKFTGSSRLPLSIRPPVGPVHLDLSHVFLAFHHIFIHSTCLFIPIVAIPDTYLTYLKNILRLIVFFHPFHTLTTAERLMLNAAAQAE